MFQPKGLLPVSFESCEALQIGPGCVRRDLPSRPGVRVWVVEMAAGSEWPHVDRHDIYGEDVFVVDGEVIEGDRRFGPGTYLHFKANSQHQPRTDIGVRLIGFNLLP